jgi:hypothetical protein
MDIALDKVTGMTYWFAFIVEILHCSQFVINHRNTRGNFVS